MRLKLGIAFLMLAIGVICMLNLFGCADSFKYEKYSSKDPELNITVDFLSGWQVNERTYAQENFTQIHFLEPKRKDKNFSASMIITVKKGSGITFQPSTLEAAVNDLVAKRMKFKDTVILSKSKIRPLGRESINIELAYKTLDKIYSADAKLIPVKERVVIFKKDNKFYFLRYENTEQEFAKFNKAFTHIIKTVRFKDNK